MSNVEQLRTSKYRHFTRAQLLLTLDIRDKEVELLIDEKKKLEISKNHEQWLHTTLKLRYKIEKLEQLGKANMDHNTWRVLTRQEKLIRFFDRAEHLNHLDFMNCIFNVSQNRLDLAGLLTRMYGALCGRIHNYSVPAEISEKPFRENELISLAKCLDVVDVSMYNR